MKRTSKGKFGAYTLEDLRKLIRDNSVCNPEGCWIWCKASDKDGYGIVQAFGKKDRAHRVSFILNVKPVPKGVQVQHICNVSSCCNPDHLELGDQSKNMKYMSKCGRAPRNVKPESYTRERLAHGEKHGQAKLTVDKVKEIRSLYATGTWTQRALARKFGMSRFPIQQIVNNKGWIGV